MTFSPGMPTGERILLTLWVGGTWAIGPIAAPVVFARLGDQHRAALLANKLFEANNVIGLLCATVLLLDVVMAAGRDWVRSWRSCCLLTAISQFALRPALRDLTSTHGPWGAATSFAHLHAIASGLYVTDTLLGLALVVFGVRAETTRGI